MVQVVAGPMLASMDYALRGPAELVAVELEPRVAATMVAMQLVLAQVVVVGHVSPPAVTDLPGKLS
jgi:hypothetical protein